MSVSTVALLLVGGGLLLYGVILFNRFVKLNALADEAWSGIDVQLKRRHDLVPALVETVKGYAKHEQETLEEVTSLRNTLRDEKNILQREGGEKTLSRDIGKLFALAEAYPDLKADQNFRKLQSDLTSVEDDLQYARRYYNGTVRDFNVMVQSFPSNLIANMMKYQSRKFFELEYVTERKTPDVDFR